MEKEISKPEGRATFRFGSIKTIYQLRFGSAEFFDWFQPTQSASRTIL